MQKNSTGDWKSMCRKNCTENMCKKYVQKKTILKICAKKKTLLKIYAKKSAEMCKKKSTENMCKKNETGKICANKKNCTENVCENYVKKKLY